jgi:hypothetical protein
MESFILDRVEVRSSEYLGDSYAWILSVNVRVNSKQWTKLRNKGRLGQLYCVDIANTLYRMNTDYGYSQPTVSDSKRSTNGFKSITIEYRFTDSDKAKRLGLKVSPHAAYGDRVILYSDSKPVLRKVV